MSAAGFAQATAPLPFPSPLSGRGGDDPNVTTESRPPDRGRATEGGAHV